MEGRPPSDTHFPEDWILSTVKAVNPGRKDLEEGPSRLGNGDSVVSLPDLIQSDPGRILGRAAVAAWGPRVMVLVKYLDAAVRLHFQVHPTADFARAHLGSPSGKTEAYHILSVRPDTPNPYIYLGFQRPPDPKDLARWIREQDLRRVESCFDPIPVKPGDTLLIPGGRPHAIGAGVLMVEIMEPTDFAVRFEFERAGYTLPEEARFMGRDLDFALGVFDFTALPADAVQARHFFRGRPLPFPGGVRHRLLGPGETPCFEVDRLELKGESILREEAYGVSLVLSGTLQVDDGIARHTFRQGDRFFFPAALGSFGVNTTGAEILTCRPPRPPTSST